MRRKMTKLTTPCHSIIVDVVSVCKRHMYMILEYAIINKFVDTGIPHKVKKKCHLVGKLIQ